jgi:hypothetical protein
VERSDTDRLPADTSASYPPGDWSSASAAEFSVRRCSTGRAAG